MSTRILHLELSYSVFLFLDIAKYFFLSLKQLYVFLDFWPPVFKELHVDSCTHAFDAAVKQPNILAEFHTLSLNLLPEQTLQGLWGRNRRH